MRAITVRQPWAWAIVHAGKDVENRTRNIAGGYRGPVAIHAGLTFDYDGLEDPAIKSILPLDTVSAILAFDQRRIRGAVIGVVDLIDVHQAHQVGGSVTAWADWCCEPWGQREAHHLVLANPRPLPKPIPAKGRLGLWTPDDDLLNQLQEALR